VLSTTYFVFHFVNLLHGQEMSEGPCQTFAFLTTCIVVATFQAPPIIAGVLFLHTNTRNTGTGAMRMGCGIAGRMCRISTSGSVFISSCVLFPWVVGVAVAVGARSDNKLGSYRGLLCYNTEWDAFSTGGMTLTIFTLCSCVTAAFIILIAYNAAAVFRNAGEAARARDATTSVLKRGCILIATFFAAWAPFVVVVAISYSGSKVGINAEMVATLFTSLQPIVSVIVLIHTESVRTKMFDRLQRSFGSQSLAVMVGQLRAVDSNVTVSVEGRLAHGGSVASVSECMSGDAGKLTASSQSESQISLSMSTSMPVQALETKQC